MRSTRHPSPPLQIVGLVTLAPAFLGLLQAKSVMLALASLAFLLALGLSSVRSAVQFPRLPIVLLAVYLLYALLNAMFVGGMEVLLDVSFLRHDGKQFATLLVFPLAVLALNNHPWQSDFRSVAEILLVIAAVYLPATLLFGEWRLGLLSGFYNSHNALGGASGSIAIISLGYLALLPRHETARWFLGIAVFILAVVVFMFAGSRAFLVGTIMAVFYAIYATSDRLRPRLFLAAGALLVLAIAISVGPLLARLDAARLASDPNVITRFQFWLRAWEYFAASPLVGVGVGTFNDGFVQLHEVLPGVAIPAYSVPFFGEHHAHNIVLHVGAEQGIVGLLLLAAFWTSILFRSPAPICLARDPDLRVFRVHQLVVRTLFIYLLGASMFDINLLVMSTAFLFYVFAASFVQCTLPIHNRMARALKAGSRSLSPT